MKPHKLHLGCGNVILPKEEGWINVDSRDLPGVDIVQDISNLSPPIFPNNSADVIYACHVLEHFGFNNVIPSVNQVLINWRNVLKRDGELWLSVPDLEVCLEGIKESKTFEDQKQFIQAIFGGCDYPENRHYNGFTKLSLKYYLEAVGFKDIKFLNGPFFVFDTSNFKINGKFISLNVLAIK